MEIVVKLILFYDVLQVFRNICGCFGIIERAIYCASKNPDIFRKRFL